MRLKADDGCTTPLNFGRAGSVSDSRRRRVPPTWWASFLALSKPELRQGSVLLPQGNLGQSPHQPVTRGRPPRQGSSDLHHLKSVTQRTVDKDNTRSAPFQTALSMT